MTIPPSSGSQRFAKIFEWVQAWVVRMDDGPGVIEPGSRLATDDAVFPDMPASIVVWHGLLTAVEHLRFFRDSYTATALIYPAAYYTVLRSALMGATQALSVLTAATPGLRQERALRIAAESLVEAKKLANASRQLPGVAVAELDRAVRQKEGQIARSAVIAAQIGVAQFDVTKKLFNMTEMVAEVCRVVFPSDPVLRHGVELLWRYQSAHAHGTLYARQGQVAGLPARTPQGVLLGRATASIGDLVTPAAATALLVNEAWRLYGELSTT